MTIVPTPIQISYGVHRRKIIPAFLYPAATKRVFPFYTFQKYFPFLSDRQRMKRDNYFKLFKVLEQQEAAIKAMEASHSLFLLALNMTPAQNVFSK